MFETIVTHDFLANELSLTLTVEPSVEDTICKNVYIKICNLITNTFYLHPTIAQIETYIINGSYDYDDNYTHTCNISLLADRQYFFRLAQAKQLQYEKLNGVGGLINDQTTQQGRICPEAIDIIKALGLYKSNYLLRF